MSLIRQKLNQAFLFLHVNFDIFSIEDIYEKCKGDKPKMKLGLRCDF